MSVVIRKMDQPSPSPEFVDEQFVSAETGLSRKTLQDWRYRGYGPPFHKLSDGPRGRVRYHWPTVKAWLEALLDEVQQRRLAGAPRPKDADGHGPHAWVSNDIDREFGDL